MCVCHGAGADDIHTTYRGPYLTEGNQRTKDTKGIEGADW